ncbi:biotin/lipoyl-binding protein [Aerococcaceae bacterium zg-ZUI334]|uniref:efflux RND transporter periplasmic adaptor subunit n=1 Tax=Aerococcaceae TaxID=186827 RepID=UPI0013D2BA2E|nr:MULTISPECIES: biotin/lipoyl-binding protein [unclassified Facklamia]MBR7926871.1 biotin/lipoyl-binding protein [Aerococcaceae bacterium zg-ZUI334]QQD64978.1 biotin/lipoyl-binding protein [Aerococcaceae bacterium zg-252]
MSLKRKLIIGIIIGLVALLSMAFALKQIFFPNAFMNNQSEIGMMNADGTMDDGEIKYTTFDVYQQDPVTVDASVKLQTDSAYFYDAQNGKIDTVLVKDGQKVKKGAVLFTYVSTDKDTQYALEDLLREQTKLYNQRVELISQLEEATGNLYNYKGDQIAYYWGDNGKQNYYIVEAIGNAPATTSSNNANQDSASDSMSEMDMGDGEGIKAQIRQVNQQIEELEIKLVRQKEKQNNRVVANTDGVVLLNEQGKDSNSVPLVRIVSEDISVVGSVNEYDFYALADERPVTIFVPAENRTIQGKIINYDKIPAYSGAANSSSDNQQNTNFGSGGNSSNNSAHFGFVVKPSEYIQPGFTAKVNISLPGFVIPNDAVVEENNHFYVFVYRDGRVKKTAIDLIQQGLQKVVLKGLNAGDRLVMFPDDLQDGQEIKILETQPFDETEQPALNKG